MSSGFPYFLPAVHEGLHALRRNWGWLLALGILEVLAGVASLSYPFLTTAIATQVFGLLLLIGAGVQLASGIWAHQWGGFFLHLISGLLYFFLGVLFLRHPVGAAAISTLVLAMFFICGGVVRLVVGFTQRYAAWGWTVLSGAISLLLGLMIWQQWPSDTVWVIGTFVGIDLIFHGWTWIMLALAVRQIPPATV